MARNAGAPPREERAEPSRAEIEQGRRQMFEVDEADLELETGFVSCESRPRLPHIAGRLPRVSLCSSNCRPYKCQMNGNVFINQFRLVSTELVDNPVENVDSSEVMC